MTPQLLPFLIFLILALVAIVSALGMLISRNAIYSALFLVMNFMTIAIFFLLLDAPFIAVAQVSVYTGAIMVLFLFVIMLLGAERAGQTQTIQWQRPLAIALAVILLLEATYVLLGQRGVLPPVTAQLPQGFGSPSLVGTELFSSYLLPFEVTSVLLLVAMIGAIVLTKSEKK
ncbi:MAG: NADH-quinone oxidoreductase subunit J [Anaerolineales bacterium]